MTHPPPARHLRAASLVLIRAVILGASAACSTQSSAPEWDDGTLEELGGIAIAARELVVNDGDTVRVLVTALDRSGAPLPALPSALRLEWSVSDPAVATVDAAGLLTARRPGAVHVAAAAPALPGAPSVSAEVTVRAVPARLVAAGGDKQAGTVGEPLPASVVARVLDRHGSAMSGVAVTFTVRQSAAGADGGAAAASAVGAGAMGDSLTVRSDDDGRAAARLALGERAGAYVIEASAAAAAAATAGPLPPARFVATAAPGAPAAVTVAPHGARLVGAGEAVEFSAAVADRFGNALPQASVSWSSLAPAVASVDTAGRVRALADGVAPIVARAGEGAADTVRVAVAQDYSHVNVVFSGTSLTYSFPKVKNIGDQFATIAPAGTTVSMRASSSQSSAQLLAEFAAQEARDFVPEAYNVLWVDGGVASVDFGMLHIGTAAEQRQYAEIVRRAAAAGFQAVYFETVMPLGYPRVEYRRAVHNAWLRANTTLGYRVFDIVTLEPRFDAAGGRGYDGVSPATDASNGGGGADWEFFCKDESETIDSHVSSSGASRRAWLFAERLAADLAGAPIRGGFRPKPKADRLTLSRYYTRDNAGVAVHFVAAGTSGGVPVTADIAINRVADDADLFRGRLGDSPLVQPPVPEPGNGFTTPFVTTPVTIRARQGDVTHDVTFTPATPLGTDARTSNVFGAVLAGYRTHWTPDDANDRAALIGVYSAGHGHGASVGGAGSTWGDLASGRQFTDPAGGWRYRDDRATHNSDGHFWEAGPAGGEWRQAASSAYALDAPYLYVNLTARDTRASSGSDAYLFEIADSPGAPTRRLGVNAGYDNWFVSAEVDGVRVLHIDLGVKRVRDAGAYFSTTNITLRIRQRDGVTELSAQAAGAPASPWVSIGRTFAAGDNLVRFVGSPGTRVAGFIAASAEPVDAATALVLPGLDPYTGIAVHGFVGAHVR